MQTNGFDDLKLSRLGFGMMRLPMKNGEIDEAETFRMTDYALENGVNYFDTAYPYLAGKSELVVGRALNRHPRESFYLATKYPGHQIAESYDPAKTFEHQLEKCGVDYFDFYLLHNVCENSFDTYMSEQWGIVKYFVEQKKRGRIRHLGFSSHANLELLETILDRIGGDMEFCQIQLNYVDWTLQRAKEKYDLLTACDMPVWVMEPVRGGKLAKLPESIVSPLRAFRPDESDAAWAFRFAQSFPNVKMILSGMSNMAQMEENIKTFSADRPLGDAEMQALLTIAEQMKRSVPCTACRYCTDGCPMNLDIPKLLSIYNDFRMSPALTPTMQIEALPENQRPSACIGCGACAAACPQKIDIPAAMADCAEIYAKQTSWAELSRIRAEEAKRLLGE